MRLLRRRPINYGALGSMLGAREARSRSDIPYRASEAMDFGFVGRRPASIVAHAQFDLRARS
jgi:hypothetical protein